MNILVVGSGGVGSGNNKNDKGESLYSIVVVF